MSPKKRYFIGIVFTVLLGTWLQYVFCCNTNSETEAIEKKDSLIEVEHNEHLSYLTQNGFHFSTKESVFYCEQNFKFSPSDYTIITPIADSINIGILELKKVLANNSALQFEIQGLYTADETNNSIHPNLGIARATSIKNYLVENGVPEEQVVLNSSVVDVFESNNSVLFDLKEDKGSASDPDEITLGELKEEINANPVRLYFNTGQSDINLSARDKEKIAKIINYLNAVQGAKIVVSGHTDNTTGPNNTNEYYSLKRAEFAKKYLIANGISSDLIITEGKSDKEPIATNDTEEGRAKNRRAEVTVK